jgi:hypothetical protein
MFLSADANLSRFQGRGTITVSELASTCSFAEIAAGSKAFKRFHIIEVGLRLPQPPLQ